MAIPMRVLMGGIVAIIVLIVAAVTLIITLSVTFSSMNKLAKAYCLSSLRSTAYIAEDFFLQPIKDLELIQELVYLSDPNINQVIPSTLSDAQVRAPMPFYTSLWLQVILRQNVTGLPYGTSTVIFDDGSIASAGGTNDPSECVIWLTNVKYHNVTGQTFDSSLLVNVAEKRITGRWPTSKPPMLPARGNSRIATYDRGKTQLVRGAGQGGWARLNAADDYLGERYLMPAVKGIYDIHGNWLALAAISVDVKVLGRFLDVSKTDKEAELFVLLPSSHVVAATTSEDYPFVTITPTTTTEPPLDQGCATTGSINVWPNVTEFKMVCFTPAASYGFAPLAEAAQGHSDVLLTTSSAVTVMASSAKGENYFLASRALDNPYQRFQYNIVILLPDRVLMSDIRSTRLVVILITAGIVILASTLAFLLVFLILKPLGRVATQMRATAQLRRASASIGRSDDGHELSRLTEIRDLQSSYYNMNAAIQSFTRYVPRDVVSGLMSSGQLCQIRMASAHCTILFCDIQGFTLLTERVPGDDLAQLMSAYFDATTAIVMSHDGLIDKYIGDCIMAVWGAPFDAPNPEAKATLTALLLNRETLIDPLKTAFDAVGEVLAIRAGVNCGAVLAGNMGSSQRMNYTVIGDPVNLAARLGSLNSQFGTRVIVSADVARQVDGIFALRLLMNVAVVGKSVATKVFDVVGILPVITEAVQAHLESNEFSGGAKRKGAGGSEADGSRSQQQQDEVSVIIHADSESAISVMSRASQLRLATRNPRHVWRTVAMLQRAASLTADETLNHQGTDHSASVISLTSARRGTEKTVTPTSSSRASPLSPKQRAPAGNTSTIVASETDVAFCAAFTSAVELFSSKEATAAQTTIAQIRSDFHGYVTSLSGLGTGAAVLVPPPMRRNVDHDRSLNLLEELVKQGVEDPAKCKGFWTAGNK